MPPVLEEGAEAMMRHFFKRGRNGWDWTIAPHHQIRYRRTAKNRDHRLMQLFVVAFKSTRTVSIVSMHLDRDKILPVLRFSRVLVANA